jgi:hypothetical protein
MFFKHKGTSDEAQIEQEIVVATTRAEKLGAELNSIERKLAEARSRMTKYCN